MLNINRRQALLGLGAAVGSAMLPAEAEAFTSIYYRVAVPEIFANLRLPPTYTPNLVIGSGFGGAISALRLAQAGETVTVIERGFRWPNAPWRDIFSSDTIPDGRAFWFRNSAKMIAGNTAVFDKFGGVMDATEFPNMTAWRAACVGGGSVVFTGVMIQPKKTHFDLLFKGAVPYDELDRVHYPRVRKMLNLNPIPSDVYGSQAFGHSREWDRQVAKAGYTPERIDSIFDWNVLRSEIGFRSRPSATVGRSNHGNANSAKFDLNLNYIRQAEATGRAKVYPGFEVLSIGTDGKRYVVSGLLRDPTGRELGRTTISCDRLFLGAGSIGTSSLLVKARAEKTLPHLNEHVGEGWGTNGDAIVVRSLGRITGLTEGTPSASKIFDTPLGMPTTFENWYVPGVPVNISIIPSLGMVLDETHRGRFVYDPAKKSVTMNWAAEGNADAIAACRAMNNKIAEASKTIPGANPFIADVTGKNWTAHPLGGAVIGKATDGYGRVVGHPGLYVMDGALLPGSAGAVNPSLTISALAERNIENIIARKG
ncbi:MULTISPECIES: GMC oxidoreductase [unclassified Aureimonas]|uniref:GMC oxidoreductase n=1 Tax=unclassified Aureimonas TaxID=2615206 RepID=UPI0006FB391E|nr:MULTISPECIES: GMC oxidoreductase [unclassified Aureimonas]KQT66194.1 cholesterol oxidase [Aureimonas sp. Leaf427]KQT72382.1 cholesterol oxidase [Aureimonas sp. Leaf460]